MGPVYEQVRSKMDFQDACFMQDYGSERALFRISRPGVFSREPMNSWVSETLVAREPTEIGVLLQARSTKPIWRGQDFVTFPVPRHQSITVEAANLLRAFLRFDLRAQNL